MIFRPTTLKEIAERSDSLEDFGKNLRDWLHELRRVSSRFGVARMIAEKPQLLAKRFVGGASADAWLAAYAEHLALAAGVVPPRWAFDPTRWAPEPWFAAESASPSLRLLALAMLTAGIQTPQSLCSKRRAAAAVARRPAPNLGTISWPVASDTINSQKNGPNRSSAYKRNIVRLATCH